MAPKTPRTPAPTVPTIPAESADSRATEPGQTPPAVAAPDQEYRKAVLYAAAHATAAIQRNPAPAPDRVAAVRDVLAGEDWTRFGATPDVGDVLAAMGPHPLNAATPKKIRGPFAADTLPEFVEGFRGVDWTKSNAYPVSMEWPLPGPQAAGAFCTFTPAMAALAERTAAVQGLLWHDRQTDTDRPLAELTLVVRPTSGRMTLLRIGSADGGTWASLVCPDLYFALYIGCHGSTGTACLYVRFSRKPADPELAAEPVPVHQRSYRRACRYAAAHAAAAIQRSPDQALDAATAVMDFLDSEDFTRFGGPPSVKDVLALMGPHPDTAAAVLLPCKVQEGPAEPSRTLGGVLNALLAVPALGTPQTAPQAAPGAELPDAGPVAFRAACRRAADRARVLLGLGGGPAGGADPTGAANPSGDQCGEEGSEWEAMARLEDADPDSQFRSGILLERRKAAIGAMVVQVYGAQAVLPSWMQPEAGPVYIPDVERTGAAVPVEVTEKDTGHLVVVVHLTRRGGTLQVHMPYRRNDGSPAFMSCA